eukprot:CAMPEP_0206450682 /NCGR_PEP_ID=MMETSP0324_2-20121206/18877_1 /ASSEMBLY_ACC=CAM_ASM_000836 /TAXON_ID=2866 /ORGANISM="Crypthecodinium cohnii, Strain Seligo" /LENGTH=709 /DNA_ID=CAMNT_0053920391 /DNA_START=129 /DNA_END=2258 /DNA_ORIENTATION=+
MEPEVPAIFQRDQVVDTVLDPGTRAKCEKVLGVLLAQAQDLDDDEADDLETLATLITFRIVLRCFQQWVVLQREVRLDDAVPNSIRDFVEKVLGLKTLCAVRDWVMAPAFRQRSDGILVGLNRLIQNHEKEMGPDLVQEELQLAVADTLRNLLSQLFSTVRLASQAEAARTIFDWLTAAFADECLCELQPPGAGDHPDAGENLEHELNTRYTNIRSKVDDEDDDAITTLCEIYEELFALQPHFATLEREVDAVLSLASEGTSRSHSTDRTRPSQSTPRTREGDSSVGQSSQGTWQVSTAALGTVPYTIPEDEAAEMQELGGGHTLLHQAAMDGDLAKVKSLLQESREDLNRQDSGGDTPLILAAHHGYEDVVQFLCSQADCDLFLGNPRAEHQAERQGHRGVKDILEKEANARNDPRRWDGARHVLSPLEEAVDLGHLEDVAVLASDPGTRKHDLDNALSLAAKEGLLEYVKIFVEEADADVNAKTVCGETPLHLAAFGGHLEVAKYLVEEAQTDVNSKKHDGATPLHLVAVGGHLEVAKYLVEEAQVDVNAGDEDEETPLHKAAWWSELEIVKYLVEQGRVDVNAKNDNGWTPLHTAAVGGDLEVAKCLVEQAKVDVNAKSNDGETPLHMAAETEAVDLVRYLIHEAGTDVNAQNKDGKTPIDVVCSSEDADEEHKDAIESLLRAAGAQSGTAFSSSGLVQEPMPPDQ